MNIVLKVSNLLGLKTIMRISFLLISINFIGANSITAQSNSLKEIWDISINPEITSVEKIQKFNQLINLFENDSIKNELAISKTFLAANYIEVKSLRLAQKNIHEAFELIEHVPDSLKYLLFMVKGDIYIRLGNRQKSNESYKSAINLIEKNPESIKANLTIIQDYASLLGNTSLNYTYSRQLDSAKVYLDRQYKLLTEQNLEIELIKHYSNKSLFSNNLQESNLNYQKALRLCDKLGEKKLKSVIYNNLAGNNYAQGKFEVSRLYLDSVRQNAGKFDHHAAYNNTRFIESGILYKEGKHEEAYLLNFEASRIRDSLNKLRTLNQFGDLEVLFNLEQSKKVLTQKEGQYQSLKNQQKIKSIQFWSITGGITLLIIIITLVIFRMRHLINKRKEINLINKVLDEERLKTQHLKTAKLKQEIDLKNKNLVDIITESTRKKEFTTKVQERLKDIKRKSKKDELIQDLIIYASGHREIDEKLRIIWDDMEDVNYAFFDKLQSKYPELSIGDINLCGLIILNLRDKEMAGIRRVSNQSIRAAKTRLRKKFGITGEIKLQEYLNEI